MEVHVPQDVIFNHILPRVPTKSVARFKCVSKEWLSFLNSDMFKNKHKHVHENNNKHMALYKAETSFEFITIDCEAPPSDKVLTPTGRPLPRFGDNTPDHDIHIIASNHGLVCLGIIKDQYDDEYSHLILWNPLTNEYKRLSKSNSHIIVCDSKVSKFGLYYSYCEDDYKLLCVDTYDGNVYIYSLKSDSWREVDASQSARIFLYYDQWSRGTYLNENLYFLQQHPYGCLRSIIRFDTKTERLSKIETPNVDARPSAYIHYCATIMAKSDCIHVCEKSDFVDETGRFYKTCIIKLWKVDGYGNMKEAVTYRLRPYDCDIDNISFLCPFQLTNNGNWLMTELWQTDNFQIYEVDLKEKKHNEDKSGKGNTYDDYELYRSVRVQVNVYLRLAINHVGYTETFVSPNQHMK